MLCFIDSPIALIALFLIVLICFGPHKVPEIANQLGRALGEFKRVTSGFQHSMHQATDIDTSYKPNHYDSYGNPSDYSASSSIPEEDLHHTDAPIALPPAKEPVHGDFAAAALSDEER